MDQLMRQTRACLCLLVVLFLSARLADAALLIPSEVSVTKGVGGTRRQALEMDLRALEAAAVQFAAGEAEAAANLDGGNHIDLLAKYTDAPGKFSPGAYSFYVVDGAWWVGVAVARDAGRENIAAGAAANGLLGSPDVDTLPAGDVFVATDGAAWKRVR